MEESFEYVVDQEETSQSGPDSLYEELTTEEQRFYLGLPHRHQMPIGTILKNAWILQEKIITNITAQGRVNQYSTLLLIGSGNGVAAVGFGKGETPAQATLKATRDALKTMRPFYRYEARTIPFKIEHEWRCTKVILTPKPEGYGITGNKVLRSFLEAVGYHDMSIKTFGTRNIYNLIICMWKALANPMLDPKLIAEGKGMIFVDVQQKHQEAYLVRNYESVGYHNFKDIVERIKNNPDRFINNFDNRKFQKPNKI